MDLENVINDYMERLEEAGTNPLVITWNKYPKSWEGHFSIYTDDITSIFKISIIKNEDYCKETPIWEFKFTRNGSVKPSGIQKEQFKVLATVRKAMYDFILEVKPEVFSFISDKSESARTAIYTIEMSKVAKNFHFKEKIDVSSNQVVYVLYKNDKFEKCVDSYRDKF